MPRANSTTKLKRDKIEGRIVRKKKHSNGYIKVKKALKELQRFRP